MGDVDNSRIQYITFQPTGTGKMVIRQVRLSCKDPLFPLGKDFRFWIGSYPNYPGKDPSITSNRPFSSGNLH